MPSNTRDYLETLGKDQLKEIWKTSDAVCFDVDSTVVEEEGIDELAEFCGVGEAVKQWYDELQYRLYINFFLHELFH